MQHQEGESIVSKKIGTAYLKYSYNNFEVAAHILGGWYGSPAHWGFRMIVNFELPRRLSSPQLPDAARRSCCSDVSAELGSLEAQTSERRRAFITKIHAKLVLSGAHLLFEAFQESEFKEMLAVPCLVLQSRIAFLSCFRHEWRISVYVWSKYKCHCSSLANSDLPLPHGLAPSETMV